LGKNNVNIRAIAQGASERNITAVIADKDVKKALNCLHESFFEVETKQLNLFVMGVGNVGSTLLSQIEKQASYIQNTLKLKINIVGLSNSKLMAFDDSGIDLSQWQETLANGEKTDLIEFFEKAKALNLRNSMFVDITANAAVAGTYEYYLKQSIAVIACNKIACSSNYEQYQNLKNLSRKYKAPFLFETNVGAGLPVIDTLNHLIASGDRIRSIHAVLSGSLNFIFNNFNESTTFYEVVKQAQKEGYTEPDPRIDLSGKDVARKLLILARESGYKLGMSDILNDGFLPEGALESSSVDDFYTLIKSKDEEFKTLLNSANNNDAKLKYVASFIDGKANVSLQEVQAGHPFYNLEGKDNIVMFYTDRYTDQPLIIKGAGAGSEVTASGLFADIIRASNI